MQRFALLCALLAGCDFFSGDKQSCPPTKADFLGQSARDPSTGTCTESGGGVGDCSDECPCLAVGTNTPATGGECDGPCEALDEQQCLADTSCHASYFDTGNGDQFWSCWDIAPITPQSGEACDGLDPFTCSIDPSCASVFAGVDGDAQFESCIAAPASGCDCTTGYHCQPECTDIACQGSNGSGCSCTPTCVPDDPTCSLVCPTGEVCMEACTATTCQDECVAGNLDPGQCTGPVTCNIAPPACPPGTTAGIEDNCYTGYCIPDADCAPEDCASLTTEAACAARSDCEAVDTGTNCTCDDSGCTCMTLTFERCETCLNCSVGSGGSGGSGF